MDIKIIDILIKAIKQLQFFSSSIEKTEIAYVNFLTKYIDNYFVENKINLTVQDEVKIKEKYRADLVISENRNKLAIIECLRINYINKQIVLSHYERMLKHYFIDDKTEYYIISFVENDKNTWKHYFDIIKNSNFQIKDISESEKDIKIGISSDFVNDKPVTVYHINAKIKPEHNISKSTNKIEKIKIFNFKLFENIEINLAPSINILLGQNGFGKTTILQAISLANMPENSIDFKLKKYIKQGQNSAELYLKRKDEKEIRITLNSEKRIIETEFTQEPIFLAYGPNIFSKETRLDYDEIINSLINGNSEWCYVNSIFSDYDDKFYNILSVLQKLSEQKNTIATKVKNLIINNLNNLIPDFKIGTHKNGSDYYFIDINKNYLDLSQLSEGYRTNILLISDIILKIISLRNSFKANSDLKTIFEKAKGVIIIDEFDRHLHPSWQRKFLTDLKLLFKNFQFVLTTHNPFSVQSAEGYTALTINNIDGKLYIDQKEIRKGLSLESIYNQYFNGNNEIYGNSTEQSLREFKKLIDKQRNQELISKEKKEFKRLTNDLLNYSGSIKGIVTREVRQLERLTGKTIEL